MSDDLTYFLIRATLLAQRFRGERGPRLQACLPVPACMSLRFSSHVNVPGNLPGMEVSPPSQSAGVLFLLSATFFPLDPTCL